MLGLVPRNSRDVLGGPREGRASRSNLDSRTIPACPYRAAKNAGDTADWSPFFNRQLRARAHFHRSISRLPGRPGLGPGECAGWDPDMGFPRPWARGVMTYPRHTVPAMGVMYEYFAAPSDAAAADMIQAGPGGSLPPSPALRDALRARDREAIRLAMRPKVRLSDSDVLVLATTGSTRPYR